MNKVLAGKQAPGFYEAILGKSTNEYMQDADVIKGNIYRNRLDGMYYSCIKSGLPQVSPNSEYFSMEPVNLKRLVNTVKRNSVIKYYITEDDAIESSDEIVIGDYIQTFGSSSINDGGTDTQTTNLASENR